jgi:EAL domain-containing protein (putative c-di-GMP-specific phosphodiesterase class I)
MYHAKNLGRSSYRAFSRTLSQRRDTHLAMAAGLMRALRRNELDLHYQPVLDLPTGGVSYVEALLRWNDPVEGILLPGRFMPVAEDGGFMRDLGHWVFEAAARQAAAWQAAGLKSFTVAVNLSASQLRDPDIVSELEAILSRAGCAPGWLALEINETSVLRDVEAVNSNLRRLRTMGLRIAIDDFGTGSSSLSHLRQLPVDTLKIDRSFMADIDGADGPGTTNGGAAIVAAVTGLARGLGLEVVAQGVEHQSQLDFLRELDCRAFQGFFACPPLPAAELERWYASR